MDKNKISPKTFTFGPRRGKYFEISDILKGGVAFNDKDVQLFEKMDLIYRTLCGIMYNFVPTSGHPGGSISSGRFVEGIIYNIADYDIGNPGSDINDMLVYAAGHKAMGLYAMYALRNELVRVFKPELLPEAKYQMRLEDLLGFRRNPTNNTPLFEKYKAKPLDGHPTPATPFVKVATGASGVGVPSAFGLALGALDYYGSNAPKVHVVEGEGGMTPGRVHEAFAAASAMRLHNITLHIDFNQASIDSNRVCREGDDKGDYVQWNPPELAYLHDFNVIYVDDGKDFQKVATAQAFAQTLDNRMPTAIVYRTIKGWKYGIEGKSSHGAGHKFCSEGYYKFIDEFETFFKTQFPRYVPKSSEEVKNEFGVMVPKFDGDWTNVAIEQTFFDTLATVRKVIEENNDLSYFADKILDSKKRLFAIDRKPRENAPDLDIIYKDESINANDVPAELELKKGATTTIRAVLGSSLGYLNSKTNGAFFGAAADLLGSTSVNLVGEKFNSGFFDAVENPNSRILSIGGICEDAMGAMMAGLGAYGHNIGSSSSYGAFISAMEHTAARLHGIGEQGKEELFGKKSNTWILINAHAGLKTGEDGPTHADPQCLQLLQGNFPKGVMITLTPWEPGEVWNLVIAGLKKRPAVLAPFVTRPNELIVDREAMKYAPASESVKGIYKVKKAAGKSDGSIVVQESGVAIEFFLKALPQLEKEGYNFDVYYVSSAELFDLLPAEEKQKIFPYEVSQNAMGITGFTFPTMCKWITSSKGRMNILHPFKNDVFLGSGNAESVLKQAGLDADSLVSEVKKFFVK